MDHLSPYRLDLLIIRDTAKRVIDDFDLFGVDIIFSGNEQNAYQELTSQLVPVFEKLISEDKAKLMRILYKIDISEQKLEVTRRKHLSAKLSEVIAHLVVEREFQKVITRKLYSSGNSSL
jgi:hypothetical protein